MEGRRAWVGLREWGPTFLLALLPLLGWWATGLTDLDEGFYGAVTAEMNRAHEWLIPLYNGHPWFEKPILLYWVAKPCLMLFGKEFGPRLPSVLASMGLYVLVYRFVRRHVGIAASKWSVLALSTSVLVAALGRMMLVDPLFVMCLSGCMFCFWNSLTARAKWRVWAALWLGLAVLAKGPVALVLFGFVAVLTYVLMPDTRPSFRGYWGLSVLVCLAVIASWYVPAYLVSRDVFVQKFLIEQNLDRFSGGDTAHRVPWPIGIVYYVPVVALGMLPWSVFLWKAWPRRSSDSSGLSGYLVLWACVVIGLFTLSGSKLPHYVLPSFVPLAVVVGIYLARRSSAWRPWPAAAWAVGLCALANAGFWVAYDASYRDLREIASFVRQRSGAVSVYAMSREGSAGGLSLNETGHPSLLFYLDRDVSNPSSFSDLLAEPTPCWVITRSGRISSADRALAAARGLRLDVEPVGRSSGSYELDLLTAVR